MVSPFDFLPYELILKIFRNAVIGRVYDSDGNFSCRKSDTYPLISLYRVCTRGRRICLNDGKLWASAIKVDQSVDPAKIRLLVRHAKNEPLVIHSDEKCSHQHSFTTLNWGYVFSHVSRWGEFFLRTRITSVNKGRLVHALVQPAPSLESFQITNLHAPSENDSIDDPSFPNADFFVLPNNLFAGRAPRLKKFAAREAYLRPSFDFSVWEQLTDLQIIQRLGGLPGNKISSKQWLKILRELKQLEVLILTWASNLRLGDPLHLLLPPELEPDLSLAEVPDVYLDCLRFLELGAKIEQNIMFDIFPKLIVPNTCKTTISTAHYHTGQELSFDSLALGLDCRIMGWHAANIPIYAGLFKQSPLIFGFTIWESHYMDYSFKFLYVGCRSELWDASSQVKASFPFYRMWKILEDREAMVTCLF